MRILRAADYKRMAWKNGGGETIEVWVDPRGASLDAFGWRVSMARVAGDGPFSVFEGIDRTLCVLEGMGLALDIAGIGTRMLSTTSDPLRFPADAPTSARLAQGAIVDLNVMTRRSVCDHKVRRIALADRQTIRPGALWTVLMPLGPVTVQAAGGTAHRLEARDALVLDANDQAVIVSALLPQSGIVIEIDTGKPPEPT